MYSPSRNPTILGSSTNFVVSAGGVVPAVVISHPVVSCRDITGQEGGDGDLTFQFALAEKSKRLAAVHRDMVQAIERIILSSPIHHASPIQKANDVAFFVMRRKAATMSKVAIPPGGVKKGDYVHVTCRLSVFADELVFRLVGIQTPAQYLPPLLPIPALPKSHSTDMFAGFKYDDSSSSDDDDDDGDDDDDDAGARSRKNEDPVPSRPAKRIKKRSLKY